MLSVPKRMDEAVPGSSKASQEVESNDVALFIEQILQGEGFCKTD